MYPGLMHHDLDRPIPAAVMRRFQDAILAFRIECFWSWDASQPVATQGVAREVIRQLRLHGGKRGWQAAADLVRCL
jgi:hypothetical protein